MEQGDISPRYTQNRKKQQGVVQNKNMREQKQRKESPNVISILIIRYHDGK